MSIVNIQLSNFNDFFGVFAGLNLLYTGSETFRRGLYRNYLNIDTNLDNITSKLEALKDKLVLLETDLDAADNHQDHLKRIEKAKIKWKNDATTDSDRFVENFKCVFLLSGLFCLSYLIIAGYSTNENGVLLYNILTLLNFLSLIILFVFFFTFIRQNKIKTGNPLAFVLYIGIVTSSYLYSKDKSSFVFSEQHIPVECNLAISIGIAISPYILHFIKLGCYILKYKILTIYHSIFIAWEYREINSIIKNMKKITAAKAQYITRISKRKKTGN